MKIETTRAAWAARTAGVVRKKYRKHNDFYARLKNSIVLWLVEVKHSKKMLLGLSMFFFFLSLIFLVASWKTNYMLRSPTEYRVKKQEQHQFQVMKKNRRITLLHLLLGFMSRRRCRRRSPHVFNRNQGGIFCIHSFIYCHFHQTKSTEYSSRFEKPKGKHKKP